MIVERLAVHSKRRYIGKVIRKILTIFCVSIPETTQIGDNVKFVHNAPGTILHEKAIIEDNVRIYQGVTLGRADIYNSDSKVEKILIKKGAILCAGAKVLCKNKVIIVGENSVIGANSVLLESTGDNEIWAGVPARYIKKRD